MAIAASKIPTNRDMTVEMVKLNNRDAHEAEKNIAPEINITKATAKTFSNASPNSSNLPNSITVVIAPGPANKGKAKGLTEIRIISSDVSFRSPTAPIFLAWRWPLTISTAIKNSRAPPAIIKDSGAMFR